MLKRLKATLSFSKFAVFAGALLLFLFHTFHLIDFHEGDAIDWRFRLRGVRKADPRILIVAIDDGSLSSLGQWPWPRKIHAAFLSILAPYRPKAVFFDFLFTEAAPDPSDDQAFAAAIQRVGNVFLSFFYQSLNPWQAQFPIPLLQKASAGSGYVNMDNEADGPVRRARLSLRAGEESFYAPAVLMAGLGNPEMLRDFPLSGSQHLWINFPGPLQAFEAVSFRELVARAGTEQRDRLKKLLEGKYILVGHTATGTTDLRATPFASLMPGIMIHASLLDTLLKRNFFRVLPEWAHLLLLLFLSGISGFIFQKMTPGRGFFILAGIIAFYFLINIGLFAGLGWILPLYVPMAAIFSAYGITLFSKYTEIRFQREIGQRELAMAARIQEQFLPQAPPQSDHLQTAFTCLFTKQVGGDLYDWQDLGGGSFAFCIGDVSGKGMPAAIYMAKALSDFRSIEKHGRGPGDICGELNHLLLQNPMGGMFLTFLYLLVNVETKKMRYASAGHDPMLWYRARQKNVEVLDGAQGMPLGMFEGAYESVEISFESGDLFLGYTDGVRELRNLKRQEWGIEGLRKVFKEEAVRVKGEAKQVVEGLFTRMKDYQGKVPAHDDRTLLCIKIGAAGQCRT